MNAQAAVLDWFAVKHFDGNGFGTQAEPTLFRDQFLASKTVLQQAGLPLCGWGYIYGIDPVGEAHAVAQCIEDGAKIVILDVEYEEVGHKASAVTFWDTLKPLIPPTDVEVWLTTDFRLLVGNAAAPWSPDMINLTSEPWPWKVFLDNVDAVLPQLYYTDFAVAPEEAAALIDVYYAAILQQGWRSVPAWPIWPTNAGIQDIEDVNALTDKYGGSASFWLMDDKPGVAYWEAVGKLWE